MLAATPDEVRLGGRRPAAGDNPDVREGCLVCGSLGMLHQAHSSVLQRIERDPEGADVPLAACSGKC